jgi:endoglucanase
MMIVHRHFLKITILIFCLVLMQCQGQKKDSHQQSDDISTPTFFLKRGVNISHWLSQSKVRGAERTAFFTVEDVKFIAEIGYDHIRIPIDEEQMWDEEGNKEEEAFKLLHNAIGWAADHNLKVIVDLHILRSHHFNESEKPLWTDPKAQEQFYQCWRDLSGELMRYPTDLVAYELMNEPVADDPEEWNVLVAKSAAVVRQKEPQRFIVIGSNRWQSVHTFDELKVPENDPYIILSFHFYHPFLLTHHQASWTSIGAYNGPVQYPGLLVDEVSVANIADADLKKSIEDQNAIYTKDSLEKMMEKPIRKAEELNLQLYCGEWGCLPTVPRESFLQWYADVRDILEKHEIGWTNWDYKGGFGIVDRRNENTPIDDFIKVLLK